MVCSNLILLTAGALGDYTNSDCSHTMGCESCTAPPGGRHYHSSQSLWHRHLESCAIQPWQVPTTDAAAAAGASSTSSMAEQTDIPAAVLACGGQSGILSDLQHSEAAVRKVAKLQAATAASWILALCGKTSVSKLLLTNHEGT